jgi:hypothetical protein
VLQSRGRIILVESEPELRRDPAPAPTAPAPNLMLNRDFEKNVTNYTSYILLTPIAIIENHKKKKSSNPNVNFLAF